MGQMVAANSPSASKVVACDADGNLTFVAAPNVVHDAVIANGQSLSPAIAMGSRTLGAILMPGAWTAASMTFQASLDGIDYFDLLDEAGTEVELTVAANNFLRLPATDWLAINYLKVRSGTSGSPVNQGGARTIKLVTVVP